MSAFTLSHLEVVLLVLAVAGAAAQSAAFLLMSALSRVPPPVNRLRQPEKALLVATLLPFSMAVVVTGVLALKLQTWTVLVPLSTLALWLGALSLLFVPLLAILRQRKIGWAGPFVSIPAYVGLVALLLGLGAVGRLREQAIYEREMADYTSSLKKTAQTFRDVTHDERDPGAVEMDEEALRAPHDLAGILSKEGFAAALRTLRTRRERTEAKLAGRGEKRLAEPDLAAASVPTPEGSEETSPGGSCAAVNPGMTAEQVKKLLGPPNEVRSTADIRGPGSVRWAWRGLSCQVHLLDDVVEFVD